MSGTAVSLPVFLMYSTAGPLTESITGPSLDELPAYSGPAKQEAAFWEKQAVETDLREICALEPNWDGYGGLPIHKDTANNARMALNAFQRWNASPELAPNPNGTISFEWETDQGLGHVEIGRTRLVGMIRLTGNRGIPISGELDRPLELVKAVAEIVHASLFYSPTQQVTENRFLADVRAAA